MYRGFQSWFFTLSQYFKAIYTSFYSPILYRQIIKNDKGLGLAYLLFLIVLGALPLSVRVIVEFDQFFKEKILFPIKALPPLNIKNGAIIYNQPMPYFIKNNQSEVVSIIDTTGTISEMNKTYPQLTVLITKNKMFIRPPSYKQFLGLAKNNQGNSIYTRIFEPGFNGILSGTEWINSTGIIKLKTLVQILVLPCIVLFYFVIFGTVLLILSAIVQLYADIFFKLKLHFKAACRFLAVAATPGLLLFFFLRGINSTAPGMGWVYGVLVLSYISFGLGSVKRVSS